MKNIVKATPDELGYRDRGIVKWLGMMLSDHSEALKKENNKKDSIPSKKQMTDVEISSILFKAYSTGFSVRIQANILEDGKYFKDVECKVIGYIENEICLLLKDGRMRYCEINEIKNIQFINNQK